MIKKIYLIIVIMTCSTITHAQEKNIIVEWAPFTVIQGVSDKELMAASDRLQRDFLVKQKGYIKRELLKGRDNRWVDLVYWVSEENAQAAAQNAINSPVCNEYFGLMVAGDPDDPSMGIFHYKKMADWKQDDR